MATHKSALKRHRQSVKRRTRNRANRSELRTAIKALRAAAARDPAEARQGLPDTMALIDRSIQKGVLHENTAARYKSRLTLLVNSLENRGSTAK